MEMLIDNDDAVELFFQFCSASEIMTFIDIGSNEPKNGAKFLSDRPRLDSQELLYYAFEANPISFIYYFEKYVEYGKNFIFLNTAISENNGFLTIHIPSADDESNSTSFIKRWDRKFFKNFYTNLTRYELASNLGGSSERHLNGSKKFTVQEIRLDTLMPSFQNKTVLWIDVEGSLLKVLNGCGSLLNSQNLIAIFAESEKPVNSKADWLELDSHKLLIKAGFNLWYCSKAHNGIYIKDSHKFLNKEPLNAMKTSSTSARRHTYLLRLKSLIFSGNNLMKNWQNK